MSLASARRGGLKRKHRRLIFVVVGMVLLAIAAALILNAARDTLVFFYSPSELAGKELPEGRAFRLGGLVENGSVVNEADGTIRFRVTDLKDEVAVTYRGILPDLFREGQGVVALGTLGADGIFSATEVLAKHDETYMPREVADAIKKAGEWRGEEGGNGGSYGAPATGDAGGAAQ
jgi:cytochrome c-type biogenesis protein CcmE